MCVERRWILSALLSLATLCSEAQDYSEYRYGSTPSYIDEQRVMVEVDSTLFRMPAAPSMDAYGDAIRYYWPQGSSRRRGLYYAVAEDVIAPLKEYVQLFEQPAPYSKLSIYGAQSGYRLGLRASAATLTTSSWSIESSVSSQVGRDMFIEGVYRNSLSANIVVNKRLDRESFIAFAADAYVVMRGLQSGSTMEVFDLVGSQFYNPSWGFYNGEVRNSRVRRYLYPSLSAHYQRDVSSVTTFALHGDIECKRRSDSFLGWYDAITPQADYYRKLPSFMPEGYVKDYVTDVWRRGDSDYTQINWDEMVRANTISSGGAANYTLEDRVERGVDLQLSAVAKSEFSSGLLLTYGVEYKGEDSCNFKEMRDLLGAAYFVDYDQFLGDEYNKTMPLQNDMRNPDRRISCGDRFGYDFSMRSSRVDAVFRAHYRAERFNFDIDGSEGGQKLYRVGYFEKERFPSTASYGASSEVSTSPYMVRAVVGYADGASRYFALKLTSGRLSPQSRNLFLNEQYANFLSPSLAGESINSAAMVVRLNYPWLSLSAELYALRSRNGTAVYSLYDDLLGMMCRASITDIGYSSYGLEMTADVRLHHDLKFIATLAAGRYLYDVNPNVELYADYDLTPVSSPTPSRMCGVNIGNAPQVAATTSLTYFGLSRWILSLSSSVSALRCEQPSIARRSERLLSQGFFNDQSRQAALSQQRLDDIFDVEISAMRFFWFEDGSRLSLRLAVRNLLADDARVVYARESDRVVLQSVDNYFTGAAMRDGLRQYGLPRCGQLSATYSF